VGKEALREALSKDGDAEYSDGKSRGAAHLVSDWPLTAWSAYSLVAFGFMRYTFSSTYSPGSYALYIEFIANRDETTQNGEYKSFRPYVADYFWITKEIPSHLK